jgi:hypothetical protein
MAHPYFHAVSSSRKFGGSFKDYLALHTWFDATKAHIADPAHRSLRHNLESIELTTRIFGDTITTSDGSTVPVTEVGQQHVHEDCGFIPTSEEWAGALAVQSWMTRGAPEIPVLLSKSVARWGGAPEDYREIHEFFDGAGAMSPLAAGLTRHHAAGIFLAEEVFGVTLTNSDGRTVPVRYLGELHMTLEFNRIPSPVDWLKAIRPKPWMRSIGVKDVGR